MMDFNSSSSISGQITALVDAGMQRVRSTEVQREYLGASRLGTSCERALQYEFAKAPVDHGRETDGRRHVASVLRSRGMLPLTDVSGFECSGDPETALRLP